MRDTIYEDICAYREALKGGRVFSSFSPALCSVFMADKEKLQGDSIFGLLRQWFGGHHY